MWGGYLPESLEAYLLLMGRKQGYVDLEFGLQYPLILRAPSAVDSWLEETAIIDPEWYGDGRRFEIPEDARHLGHRGGGRFFFVLDAAADPVVYQMREGASEGSGVSSTNMRFSEVVLQGLHVPRRMVERSLQSVVRRRKMQNG